MNPAEITTALADQVRDLLLQLARREDAMANQEVAQTPYWASPPASVVGHRGAAAALRTQAAALGAMAA